MHPNYRVMTFYLSDAPVKWFHLQCTVHYKTYTDSFWPHVVLHNIRNPFCELTCSDSSSLMFVRPSMVALTVERIFSWVLMVGIRSHTFGGKENVWVIFCTRQRVPQYAWVCLYLQEVGSDASIGALLGNFFGQSRHLIWGLGDVLSTLNQRSLVPASPTNQPRHFCHQQSHPLGCCYDVVTLWGGGGGSREKAVRAG